MSIVAQFMVGLFDLIEAEGRLLRVAVRAEARAARAKAARFVLGVVMLVAAVPILLAGLGLTSAALFWWLQPYVGQPAALGILGAVWLIIGLTLVARFNQLAGPRRDPPGSADAPTP